MAESLVQVTEGAGKKLHTYSRIIGANTVEDEAVVPGEYPIASYIVQTAGTSCATANDHVLELMAAAAVNLRVRRITVIQTAAITAAALCVFQVFRLSTAGTGGTVVTPRPNDSADAAASGTAMTLPTVKGTEGVALLTKRFVPIQTLGAGGLNEIPHFEWVALPGAKSILIPAGATNGICLKTIGAYAGLSVEVTVEYVETSFAG